MFDSDFLMTNLKPKYVFAVNDLISQYNDKNHIFKIFPDKYTLHGRKITFLKMGIVV